MPISQKCLQNKSHLFKTQANTKKHVDNTVIYGL